MLVRGPSPALRPFVHVLWASEPSVGPAAQGGALPWERMLPSGRAHVVLRLTGPSLRLLAADTSRSPQVIRRAVVGGPRTSAYAKEAARGAETVGAQLSVGATRALLGVPGRALAGVHVPLDEVLGPVSESWCDELHALPSARARLLRFQALLTERLSDHAPHAVVQHGIARLSDPLAAVSVQALVSESGYSHRRFLDLFEESTGVTPKRFARVVRFRATLAALQRGAGGAGLGRVEKEGVRLAALASQLGYADQAHLTREFRAHTGITPARYQLAEPHQLYHLPLPAP
ncbi:MAG: AraC family transcriptional regulator [Sandaracinaceae bacterium]|nr:AraC family transcriptional regulator [Sandaracinaceae bacterium]